MASPGATKAAAADATPVSVRVAVALGGALLLGFYAWRALRLCIPVDDAFISARYAENLARHGELVFNLGERVEGFSNLGWTLAMAACIRLGIDPIAAAVVLGHAAALLAGILVFHGARRHLDAPLPLALLGAAICWIPTSFVFWAGAGLETTAFAALLAAWWLACRGDLARPPSVVAAVALTGAIATARPEGAGILVVTPLAFWLGGLRGARWFVASVLACVPLLAQLAFRLDYYGAWLPNTALAKGGVSVDLWWRGLTYLAEGFRHDGLWAALPLLLFAGGRGARARELGVLCLGYAAFIVWAGGDGLYRYRLIAHILPWLALWIVAAACALHLRSARAAVAGALLLCIGLVAALGSGRFHGGLSIEDVHATETRWERLGLALAALPPDTLLATNVAGRVPYHSRLPTIDLLGLTDPVISRTRIDDLGRGMAGHERANPRYVIGRSPDLVYLSVLDGMPAEHFAEPYVRRRALRAGPLHRYEALFDDPGFQRAYRAGFVAIGGGKRANLLVRSASPAARELEGAPPAPRPAKSSSIPRPPARRRATGSPRASRRRRCRARAARRAMRRRSSRSE